MRKKYDRALFERYDPTRSRGGKGDYRPKRYVAIAAVFLLVLIFFVIKLAALSGEGAEITAKASNNVERTYTVAGLRGEIYDRNGVLLVGNKLSYDIVFEYGAIPDTTREFNESILAALEALRIMRCEDKMPRSYCVLEGTYENYRYSSALSDKESDEYTYFMRIIDANKLDPEMSANDFADALQKKYKLYEDYYTNEEIDALIRIRYELERVKFGVYQPYTLAEDVPMELISYVEEHGIEGVNFKISTERYFTYPGYASHILGRVGKIQAETLEYYVDELGYSMNSIVGTSGCEKAFESYLHAEDGILAIEYDKDGNVVDKYYKVEPISGHDVYLTLDIELQIAAEDELKKTVSDISSAKAGAAVSLEADTGAVLAIASYPTFDATQIRDPDYYKTIQSDPDLPELNRALSGVYAPGSVYKVGVALAALEEGAITTSTRSVCNHVFPHLHQPTCLGTHGSFSVAEAIRESCNVFFYYVGMNMGTDAITKYTSALGLGRPTGIELPERAGTIGGKMNSPDPWSTGNDLSAAIGQANHGYPPLQIGVYISAVANGGERYAAHLLGSVREFYTGKIIYEYTPTVLESTPISPTTHSTLLNAMRTVVTSHDTIARNFSSLPVSAGGKTGTAQVYGKYDYAVFAGVAPYNDPEIVGVCIIEEGLAGGNASRTVGKIFKAYYDQKERQNNEE